jgi:hypothetical protein
MGIELFTGLQPEEANELTLLDYLYSTYDGVRGIAVHAPTGEIKVIVRDNSTLDQAELDSVLATFDHSLTPLQQVDQREPLINQSAVDSLDLLPAWVRKPPASLGQFVNDNVTDLQSAKQAIRSLAIAVSVLARTSPAVRRHIAENETE